MVDGMTTDEDISILTDISPHYPTHLLALGLVERLAAEGDFPSAALVERVAQAIFHATHRNEIKNRWNFSGGGAPASERVRKDYRREARAAIAATLDGLTTPDDDERPSA